MAVGMVVIIITYLLVK